MQTVLDNSSHTLRGVNLEEKMKQWCPEFITTGFVARQCGVSKVTVLRWIEKGRLVAFRLPDGHYRILRENFGEFLEEYRLPVHQSGLNTKDSCRGVQQGEEHGLGSKG